MMHDGYIERLKLLGLFQVFLPKLLTQMLTLKLLKEVPPGNFYLKLSSFKS